MSSEEHIYEQIQQHLKEMSELNSKILTFLDENEDEDANYKSIIQSIDDIKIVNDRLKLIEFLHLIQSIANNYHRRGQFYEKIERIIIKILPKISEFFTQEQIFNIFCTNNRLLLFLINEKVIELNHFLINKVIHDRKFTNLMYFFRLEKKLLKIEKNEFFEIDLDDEQFDHKQKQGENSNTICELIRNDSIDDFILYQNLKNVSIDSKINDSIFETNRFLIENETNLIQYAAFYGSFRIFKYLLLNKACVDSHLWLFAIHGRNYEIIHLLEEKCVKCPFKSAVSESIKCHHNEMADYLLNSLSSESGNDNNDAFLNACMESFYFAEICNFIEYENPNYLLNLACKYDYCYIVDLLLKINDIDVNKKMAVFCSFLNNVLFQIFCMKFQKHLHFNEILTILFV